MNTDLFFSSKSDLWSTPRELFDELDQEFHFGLDVCATPENAKCARYFTEEQDGLAQTWSGTVWCNPPYGKTISKWIKKGAESAESGATVVMLLPVRTNTGWFHDLVYGKAEIRFIRGKLKFGGFGSTAPFPSMVVIFRPKAAVEFEARGKYNPHDGTNREAEKMALTALRGPTREMVERMFPGCEMCEGWNTIKLKPCANGDLGVQADIGSSRKEDTFGLVVYNRFLASGYVDLPFCPFCGKPKTDEAVDMMMDKWKEVLNDD